MLILRYYRVFKGPEQETEEKNRQRFPDQLSRLGGHKTFITLHAHFRRN